MTITRRNHYVPIWYQKRFLPSGQTSFSYLDIYPEERRLPDGRIIIMNGLQQWGPNKCFWEKDLYTTSIFGVPNDEIERYLFGDIDQKGSEAVFALVSQDIQKLYHLFSKVFEYLDAQKLRTPKGLDWIRSHYPKLTQIELMLEIQHLRQMHCTMWIEAVREIVSAEDSDVKFIITDHPVTVYNPVCPPSSLQCKYPDDPSIALKASQTIFPLDLNHCLILTNLEYARNPDSVDPLSKRTHARHFGQTLTRFDTMIRTRRLQKEAVSAINIILKSRSRRFIAAAKEEWLYPETMIKSLWSEVGKVLLPPQNELWYFGGEIYVGYKDGSTHYQDEFGRTTGDLSYLKKPPLKGKIGANDPCPCGSGKKYKKCCRDKAPADRPLTTEYSIRERNITLFNAVTDILGLSKGKTWEDVRRELSDEQVKEIHKVIASLWPRETNLMDLLPRPDSAILRALYAGLVDPRVILRNVVGFSLYADEIIVVSPFTNPSCVKKEYSPVHSPTQYKQETIKNVLLLMQLAPFIDAGIVHLIPDPCDFDYKLRTNIWDMAKERLKRWKPSKEEYDAFEPLYREDFMRSMWGLPEESLKRQIRKAVPHISDDGMSKVLEHIEEMRVHDPLALLQPLPHGKEGGQLLKSQLSPNLELGLLLSQITGSFIYTDSLHRWNEILGTSEGGGMPKNKGWELVAEKLSCLPFTFLNQVDPQTTFDIRQSGRLGDFRKVLRQLWINVQNDLESEAVGVMAQRIAGELKEAHEKAQADWHSIQKELQIQSKGPFEPFMVTINGKIDCRIPSVGFGLNAVYRLLLSHSGRTDYLKNLPMVIFIEFGK